MEMAKTELTKTEESKPIIAKPKKSITAFFYYQKDRRSKLKETNPDAKNIDLINKMAEEWRGMQPEAKETYNKLSDLDKQRYKKQMDSYKEKSKSKK